MSDFRYFLGYAHLRYTQAILKGSDDTSFCLPFLDDLHMETKKTVFYAVNRGQYSVVMEVRGLVNSRIAMGQGELNPPHCTAAGKAIFAFLPKSERYMFYETIELRKYTSKTKIEIDVIEKEFEKIRNEHIAYNFGEYHIGINAISSPVFNRHDLIAGAITIVGTSEELDKKTIRDYKPKLLHACNVINKQLRGFIFHEDAIDTNGA
jgi:DNA-binding IclR family transcriptional regulator